MRALDPPRIGSGEPWRLWDALGELWEVLGELWEGLGELWEGLVELWDSPERLTITRDVSPEMSHPRCLTRDVSPEI